MKTFITKRLKFMTKVEWPQGVRDEKDRIAYFRYSVNRACAEYPVKIELHPEGLKTHKLSNAWLIISSLIESFIITIKDAGSFEKNKEKLLDDFENALTVSLGTSYIEEVDCAKKALVHFFDADDIKPNAKKWKNPRNKKWYYKNHERSKRKRREYYQKNREKVKGINSELDSGV